MSHARTRIGGTELRVSPLSLGAAQFGTGLSKAQSFDLLDALVGLGGNLVDTAHVYNDFAPGAEKSLSEKIIGQWVRLNGVGDLVVTTKAGHPAPDTPDKKRINPVDLRQDVEGALENLGFGPLPLLYLHRDDPSRPVEDILGILEDFCKEGLVRHYAASNWSTARLTEARAVAARLGYQGFVANQTEWSLARRNPGTAPGTSMDLTAMDDEMIAFHAATGLTAAAYWSQCKGYFDKYASGRVEGEAARCYDSPHSRRIAEVIVPIAARVGATPTQVMLAAQMRTAFTTIPIVGCRNPDQLGSSFSSLDVILRDEDVAALNRVAGFTIPLAPRPRAA